MTTKMLDEIGEALKDNGFVFMEFGNRHCTSVRDSTTNYGYFGVLRDNGAESDASERLAGVLVAIKKKGIYLVLSPKVRTIRRYWEMMSQSKAIGPREVMACFIEKGLFQVFEDTAVGVRDALKGNFAYQQEDEKILKLEKLITQTLDVFGGFRWGAYSIYLTEELSVRLREHLLATDIAYSGEFFPYMEDNAQWHLAEEMCAAAHCLDVICAGME